jgi:hypothetical protein
LFPCQGTRHEHLEDKEKNERKLTCPDVQPTHFSGLRKDVCFHQRDHLKQLVVRGNVYVLVYDSAAQLREGPKKKESFEEKIAGCSTSLRRDALKMVVRDRGGKKTEKQV